MSISCTCTKAISTIAEECLSCCCNRYCSVLYNVETCFNDLCSKPILQTLQLAVDIDNLNKMLSMQDPSVLMVMCLHCTFPVWRTNSFGFVFTHLLITEVSQRISKSIILAHCNLCKGRKGHLNNLVNVF